MNQCGLVATDLLFPTVFKGEVSHLMFVQHTNLSSQIMRNVGYKIIDYMTINEDMLSCFKLYLAKN